MLEGASLRSDRVRLLWLEVNDCVYILGDAINGRVSILGLTIAGRTAVSRVLVPVGTSSSVHYVVSRFRNGDDLIYHRGVTRSPRQLERFEA